MNYADTVCTDVKKLEAFYECYPQVKDTDCSLHHATWETFSFIWDKAVENCKNNQQS